MSFRKWEVKRTFYEARVTLPATTHELQQALDWIEHERDGWGTEEITIAWCAPDLVFSFPGDESSIPAK